MSASAATGRSPSQDTAHAPSVAEGFTPVRYEEGAVHVQYAK